MTHPTDQRDSFELLLDLRLSALSASAIDVDAQPPRSGLPKMILVLGWGENKTASGRKAICGPLTLSTLQANQARLGFEEIALDYEHNTVPGTKAYKESSEPRKVAAYGVLVPVEGKGVYFVPTRWTPSGRESAAEFQDISPAPATNDQGEVIFVHSVALCRQGDIEDLRFVPFSAMPPDDNPQENKSMDYKSALIELINTTELSAPLAASATDADIGAALAKVKEAKAASGVQAMTAITTLSADVQAMKARDTARERDDIRRLAAQAGKVIPLSAEQIEKTEPAVLREMVERLPVTVPLSRRTPEVQPMSAAGASVIEKYNALADPEERARYFAEHRAEISGK